MSFFLSFFLCFFLSLLTYLRIFVFIFPSFASSEAKEILDIRETESSGKSFSNYETKNNSLSHLFKIASQEIETTYSRSLEISEKYFDLQKDSNI